MPKHATGDGKLAARSFWSGAITFGLVSIPVDLMSAIGQRHTAMKMVDRRGHPLGREYRCSKDGKRLSADQLVRGYETDSGKTVVVTDEEFESFAPETSNDIELLRFVPLEQIPSLYYDRPYFLAPAGRSTKAYHLLAETMEKTGRVAIGSFVMRAHQYLVAIVPDHGILRATTLRHAADVRTPAEVGLPKRIKPAAKSVRQFEQEIQGLIEDELDLAELEDRDARALHELAEAKQKKRRDVVRTKSLEDEESETGDGAQVIDIMHLLRKSLSKRATVSTAASQRPTRD